MLRFAHIITFKADIREAQAKYVSKKARLLTSYFSTLTHRVYQVASNTVVVHLSRFLLLHNIPRMGMELQAFKKIKKNPSLGHRSKEDTQM